MALVGGSSAPNASHVVVLSDAKAVVGGRLTRAQTTHERMPNSALSPTPQPPLETLLTSRVMTPRSRAGGGGGTSGCCGSGAVVLGGSSGHDDEPVSYTSCGGSAFGTTGAEGWSGFFAEEGGVTSRQRWAMSRLMLTGQHGMWESDCTHHRSQGRPPSQTIWLASSALVVVAEGIVVLLTFFGSRHRPCHLFALPFLISAIPRASRRRGRALA